MPVNKVIYGGQILIDITDSTVTPDTLAEGIVAYDASGRRIVGRAKIVPDGYSAFIDANGLSLTDADGNIFVVKEER